MKLKILLSALLFSIAINGFSNPPNERGKTIFTARCGSCHNINKMLVGPALAGVDERRSMDWILKFVQSSQTLIKSGDKEAIALFSKFNVVMPDHADLKADDIKNIVAYIKSETRASKDNGPFTKPQKLHPFYLPVTLSNYGFFTALLFAIILVMGSLLFFVRVKEYERNQSLQE